MDKVHYGFKYRLELWGKLASTTRSLDTLVHFSPGKMK